MTIAFIVSGGVAAGALLVPLNWLSPGATTPPDGSLRTVDSEIGPATFERSTDFVALGDSLSVLRIPETETDPEPDEPIDVIDEPEEISSSDIDWIYAGYLTLDTEFIAFLTIDGMTQSVAVGDLVQDLRGNELEVESINEHEVILNTNAGSVTLRLETTNTVELRKPLAAGREEREIQSSNRSGRPEPPPERAPSPPGPGR